MDGKRLFVIVLVAIVAPQIHQAVPWQDGKHRFDVDPENLDMVRISNGFANNDFAQNPHYKFLFQQLMKHQPNLDDEECQKLTCTANLYCCEGYVCDGNHNGMLGICVVPNNYPKGARCQADSDCEIGLLCVTGDDGGNYCGRLIAIPVSDFQSCRTSKDCDIQQSLCCQYQRRNRHQPRKVMTHDTQLSSSLARSFRVYFTITSFFASILI